MLLRHPWWMSFPLKLNDSHKRLLNLIRRHQPATRAQIGKLGGLGSGPVTQLTRDLLLVGLIREGERIRGSRGQPALPLELDPSGALSFGVGMIPGKLRVVAVDFTGCVVAEAVAATSNDHPEAIGAIIASKIEQMCKNVGKLDPDRILGVGFALPGYFFDDATHMHVVDEHASWRHKPLSELFSREIGLPCWIENDATAASIAEFYQQSEQADCLITLLVNYGIGSGLIIDGKPFRGGHGNAGEVGAFFPIDQPRPSGTDLLRQLSDAGCSATSLSDITLRDASEHEASMAWAKRAGNQLGSLISSAWSWLDPELIVVSGSLPQALLAEIVQHLSAPSIFAEHPHRPSPQVRASRVGPSVAAIGAAHIPLHEFTATAPY